MDMNRRTLLGLLAAATVAPTVSFAAEDGPVVSRYATPRGLDRLRGYSQNSEAFDRISRLYRHEVKVEPIPEDKAVRGEPFSLECTIVLLPDAVVQQWADETGGAVAFGFHDETNRIMMQFPSERVARSFEARFGNLELSDEQAGPMGVLSRLENCAYPGKV